MCIFNYVTIYVTVCDSVWANLYVTVYLCVIHMPICISLSVWCMWLCKCAYLTMWLGLCDNVTIYNKKIGSFAVFIWIHSKVVWGTEQREREKENHLPLTDWSEDVKWWKRRCNLMSHLERCQHRPAERRPCWVHAPRWTDQPLQHRGKNKKLWVAATDMSTTLLVTATRNKTASHVWWYILITQ